MLHNAATHVVFFKKSRPEKVYEALTKRMGMTKDAADYLIEELPSRWFCLTTTMPQLIISPTLVVTLNALNKRFRKGKK